jgi:hypothetical protein
MTLMKTILTVSSIFFCSHMFAQPILINEVTRNMIDSIPVLLAKNYVNKEKGKTFADAFKKNIESGKYLRITDPDTLAKVLTSDLKNISHDGHVYIQHLKGTEKENADWEQFELENERNNNYGFTETQILTGNIGYLKIVEFMNPKRAMPTAVAAMKMIENTSALIIDIRGNGGGYPGIMEYILNHYYEGEPVLLSTTYFSDTTIQPKTTYSSDLVYGKLRINTPLYILVDNKTASAAEYFAYTLQAAKKAIVIGETTAGGANMNDLFPLPGKFRMSISTATPINGITKTNWEMKGVIPDIQTSSQQAKDKAYQLITASGK